MDEEEKKPHLVILPRPEPEEPEDPEEVPAPEDPDYPDDLEEPDDWDDSDVPEEEIAEAAEDAPEEESRPRRVVAVIFTVILIALAALVFIYRDTLTGENLREFFGVGATATVSEAFAYDAGTGQIFAPVGSGLAVATASSLQLMDAAGETVFKQVVSFHAPAVFGAGGTALFCDLGGTGCVTARLDGTSAVLTPGGTILSASMNENGWIALTTDAAGYKGVVSVYDDTGAERYKYWSGTGYVLSAKISPDNRTLAALCGESGGGKLHLFRLDQDGESALAAFENALPFDIGFLGNDRLCLVGSDALRFLTTAGTELGSFELGEYRLLDYELGGDGFVSLYVSASRTGGGLVETLGRDGTLLAWAETERDALSLSASGKNLLVMTGAGLTVYDQNLNERNRYDALMTARRAILRADGDVLLLGTYGAEKISF